MTLYKCPYCKSYLNIRKIRNHIFDHDIVECPFCHTIKYEAKVASMTHHLLAYHNIDEVGWVLYLQILTSKHRRKYQKYFAQIPKRYI
ncbi:MAG: hypothetical protein QXO37_06845 [Candidatus Nitrosocaldaceae archaeon]